MSSRFLPLALLLLPATALGQAPAPSPIELPPLVVTGERDRQDPLARTEPAYRPSRAVAATKTDTPRLEVPQSVSVVTADQARDQGARSFADALRFEPGVTGFASGGILDNLAIRGFNTDSRIFQDGLLRRNATGPEILGLERIEILRGPGSVLYGGAPVGGIVSALSKRPTDQAVRNLSAGAGLHNFYEAFGDLSGRLSEDGEWLGRLTGVYRRGGTTTRLDETDWDDRYYIAPALTWRRDGTRVTLLGSFQRDDTNVFLSGNGLPARGTVLPNPNGQIARGRNFLEPNDDRIGRVQTNIWRGGWDIEHAFSDAVRLRQNAAIFRLEQEGVNVQNLGLRPDLRTIDRQGLEARSGITNLQADTHLQVRFGTGPLSHTVLAGFDVSRRTENQAGGFGALAPLDLYAPRYGLSRPVFRTAVDQRTEQNQFGLYVQDQIRLPGRITLTGGLRFDAVQTRFENRVRASTTENADSAVTGRGGVTWEFIEGLALYASYAESFLPQTGTTSAGMMIDPERGRQWEAGAKASLPGDWLVASAALFDIERQNVSAVDAANPLFVRPTGEQRSRGFELQGSVAPLPGLQLIAGYTRLAAEVTRDTNARLIGTRPINVPNWQANLWAVYDFAPETPLAGWRIGGGVRHVGQRNGDQTAASFTLPAYTLLDAFVEYRTRDGWTLGVHGRNLSDQRFFVIGYGVNAVQFGEPLSVIGRVAKAF